MNSAKKTVKELVESEVGVKVTNIRQEGEKEFLGVVHGIWRARTADGTEWWGIPYPVAGVYPIEEWSDVDRLFSYHLGSAFRFWDEQQLIHVVAPPFIGAYPAESPCR